MEAFHDAVEAASHIFLKIAENNSRAVADIWQVA
jgi:hypothetical protein